jgi:hypothetical protein
MVAMRSVFYRNSSNAYNVSGVTSCFLCEKSRYLSPKKIISLTKIFFFSLRAAFSKSFYLRRSCNCVHNYVGETKHDPKFLACHRLCSACIFRVLPRKFTRGFDMCYFGNASHACLYRRMLLLSLDLFVESYHMPDKTENVKMCEDSHLSYY